MLRLPAAAMDTPQLSGHSGYLAETVLGRRSLGGHQSWALLSDLLPDSPPPHPSPNEESVLFKQEKTALCLGRWGVGGGWEWTALAVCENHFHGGQGQGH